MGELFIALLGGLFLLIRAIVVGTKNTIKEAGAQPDATVELWHYRDMPDEELKALLKQRFGIEIVNPLYWDDKLYYAHRLIEQEGKTTWYKVCCKYLPPKHPHV